MNQGLKLRLKIFVFATKTSRGVANLQVVFALGNNKIKRLAVTTLPPFLPKQIKKWKNILFALIIVDIWRYRVKLYLIYLQCYVRNAIPSIGCIAVVSYSYVLQAHIFVR